ncbi:MAG: urease accessory protein UreD [Cyanophyceae cyanobacterium]
MGNKLKRKPESNLKSNPANNHLEITVAGDRHQRTIVTQQYTAYPLRLSKVFRLDQGDRHRAYLYITNTSPGLLAGDIVNVAVTLDAGASLYLTDQSATKVHAMPVPGTKAIANTHLEIAAGASLEFMPEPVILFAEATSEQITHITLHSEGALFWSEVILPGRLARGEYYDFSSYKNRVEIESWDGELWFREAINLAGKSNKITPFQSGALFAEKSVLATLIIVQPHLDLTQLAQKLDNLEGANFTDLSVANSTLPGEKGLLVRVLGDKTSAVKKYLQYALNCVRQLGDRPQIPYIPK